MESPKVNRFEAGRTCTRAFGQAGNGPAFGDWRDKPQSFWAWEFFRGKGGHKPIQSQGIGKEAGNQPQQVAHSIQRILRASSLTLGTKKHWVSGACGGNNAGYSKGVGGAVDAGKGEVLPTHWTAQGVTGACFSGHCPQSTVKARRGENGLSGAGGTCSSRIRKVQGVKHLTDLLKGSGRLGAAAPFSAFQTCQESQKKRIRNVTSNIPRTAFVHRH